MRLPLNLLLISLIHWNTLSPVRAYRIAPQSIIQHYPPRVASSSVHMNNHHPSLWVGTVPAFQGNPQTILTHSCYHYQLKHYVSVLNRFMEVGYSNIKLYDSLRFYLVLEDTVWGLWTHHSNFFRFGFSNECQVFEAVVFDPPLIIFKSLYFL